MDEITYTDFDREIWDKDLESFVPDTIYDMHTHMWSEAHCGSVDGPPRGLRLEINFRSHLDWAQNLYPGREFHMLVLGTPIPGIDYQGHNDWMAAELEAARATVVTLEADIARVTAELQSAASEKDAAAKSSEDASAKLKKALPDCGISR